jgi:hypothetical protein
MSINCQQSNPDLIPVEVDPPSRFAAVTLEQASRDFYDFDDTYTAEPDDLHPDHTPNGYFQRRGGTTGHFSRQVNDDITMTEANWLKTDKNGMVWAGGFQDFLEKPAGQTTKAEMYQVSHKIGNGKGFESLGERRIRPIESVGAHDRGSTYVVVPVLLPDDASVHRYPREVPIGTGEFPARLGNVKYTVARSGTHGTYKVTGGPSAGNEGSWKDFYRGGQPLTHFTNTIRTADGGANFYAFEVPTGTPSIGGHTTTGFVRPLPREDFEEEFEEET